MDGSARCKTFCAVQSTGYRAAYEHTLTYPCLTVCRWRHSFQFSLIFGVPVIVIRTYFMLATMAYSHDHSSQGNSTDVSITTVTMVFPGLSLENLLLFLFCTPCQVCLKGFQIWQESLVIKCLDIWVSSFKSASIFIL